MDAAALLDRLASLLDPGGVLRGDDEAALVRYCRDWSGDHVGRPLAVIRPGSTEQVAESVRLCFESGVPVVPQGGNTGLVAGGIPTEDGREVVLSLERMNRIRTIDAASFSIVAEAGCILADLHQAAEAVDCALPLSLGAQGSCQIGGNVSTNAGGVNVLRYGMTRDLVLGLEVVLPGGRIWHGLRRLRKDNTGYDLRQLFIGAEGTLGVITAVALKLFSRPTELHTAIVGVGSVAAALDLYARARTGLSDLLSAFELIPRACFDLVLADRPDWQEPFARPTPVTVLMEASASGLVDVGGPFARFLEDRIEAGQVLDGTLAQSRAQAAAFWRWREEVVEAQHRRGRHLRTDISVPIAALADFMAAADAAMAAIAPTVRAIAYGHVGDGNIHYNVLPPAGLPLPEAVALLAHCEELLFTLVDRFDGSISAEHGIGRLKRSHFLQRLTPVEASLMRTIKSGIDPAGLMNPGRILS